MSAAQRSPSWASSRRRSGIAVEGPERSCKVPALEEQRASCDQDLRRPARNRATAPEPDGLDTGGASALHEERPLRHTPRDERHKSVAPTASAASRTARERVNTRGGHRAPDNRLMPAPRSGAAQAAFSPCRRPPASRSSRSSSASATSGRPPRSTADVSSCARASTSPRWNAPRRCGAAPRLRAGARRCAPRARSMYARARAWLRSRNRTRVQTLIACSCCPLK